MSGLFGFSFNIGQPKFPSTADTTPPSLLSATDISTGIRSATLTVSTNEAGGTLYWYVSTSASVPSASDLIAGVGAAAFGSAAVQLSGVQIVAVDQLNPSTAYHSFFMHVDASGNRSAIATTDGFTTLDPPDATPPVLSAPTDTATGSTTATIGVTTNEANGTLYWFVSQSASPPTAVNLKAGLGAVLAGSVGVTSAGTFTFNLTGLSISTGYYSYFLHRDAAGNESVIAETDGFITTSGAVVVTGSLPNAQWGVPYTGTLNISGGSGSYTLSGLPTGLNGSFSSGVETISGTPS